MKSIGQCKQRQHNKADIKKMCGSLMREMLCLVKASDHHYHWDWDVYAHAQKAHVRYTCDVIDALKNKSLINMTKNDYE